MKKLLEQAQDYCRTLDRAEKHEYYEYPQARAEQVLKDFLRFLGHRVPARKVISPSGAVSDYVYILEETADSHMAEIKVLFPTHEIQKYMTPAR